MKKIVQFSLLFLVNYCISQSENVGLRLNMQMSTNEIDLSQFTQMQITIDHEGSPYHTNNPLEQYLFFKANFYLKELCSSNEIFIQQVDMHFLGTCIDNDGTGSWINLNSNLITVDFGNTVPNGNYQLFVRFEQFNFTSAISTEEIRLKVNSNTYSGINQESNTRFDNNFVNPFLEIQNLVRVINSNNQPISLNTNVISTNCTNSQESVLAVATGGTPNYTYTYHINGNNFTQNPISLFAGNYSITINDANGCTETFPVSVLGSTIPQFDYFGALVIDQGFNFSSQDLSDGVIRIKGTMIIEENVNSTFENIQFEFYEFDSELNYPDVTTYNNSTLPKSGIILNQNSNLTLNNVILQNVPACNNMWQGIKVLGHASNRMQGAKLILNNATIENAHTAVNSGDFISQLGQNFDQYILNGTIEATGSTFRNNNVALNFADSHGENMPSFVRECTFECTAPLLDQALYFGRGSSVFINMVNTRSLSIKANTFKGLSSFNPAARGTAIRSFNANYRVTSGLVSGNLIPNTFLDLTKGIDIYSSGSLTDVVQIKDNDFNNVMQGITANNSNFDEISFNDFWIPEGRPDIHSWGINLQACDGFMVTENVFNTLPSGDFSYTYGNISKNISETGGQVYHNQFPGLFQVATQTEQKSTSLQITCNTYANQNRYDWAVTSGNILGQGNPATPAGNVFDICNANDESQIFKASFVPNFDYYRFSNSPMPPCISMGVNVQVGVAFDPLIHCIQQVDLPSGYVLGGGNSNAGGKGKGNANGLSNAEYNQLKAKKMRQDLRDGNFNGVISLIQNSTDQKDIKKLVPTYLAIGDCVKAREKLNQIDRSTAEGNEFYLLHDVLVNACAYGRKLKYLNQQEIAQVEQIKNNSATRIKTGAESVLALKNENQLLRYAEPLVTSSNIDTQNEINTTNEKESFFVVYPNPSEGEVNIQTTLEMGTLQIVDALGRIHATKSLVKDETVNLTLETGIYIVRFIDNLGNVETKQLFIQK